MELPLRRAFIGYCRRPTLALLESMDQEIASAQSERDERLADMLRHPESLVAREQEEQRVLLALFDELAARGVQVVDEAKAEFAQREAIVLAEIARREMLLGQRRQQLRALRDDVGDAAERAILAIEVGPDDDGRGIPFGVAREGVLAVVDAQLEERAGA